MKNILSFLLVMTLAINSSFADAQEMKELEEYVIELIDEGYNILNNPSLSDKQKYEKSRQLIESHLHLDWMAKYALGRHRRTISKEKMGKFVKVYSEFVVQAYTDLSLSYGGEKAELKRVRQLDDDLYIVNTEIIKPNQQQPIKVDYLVHEFENNTKHPYRVGDIITEGISILNSQQAEFGSFISSRGIDALIADLRDKSKKFKESNDIKLSKKAELIKHVSY